MSNAAKAHLAHKAELDAFKAKLRPSFEAYSRKALADLLEANGEDPKAADDCVFVERPAGFMIDGIKTELVCNLCPAEATNG